MSDTKSIIAAAHAQGLVVPGFNIPYLPMMEPVVAALRDCGSLGLIMVARLEWEKFESGSLEDIRNEYEKVKDENHTRLHLDHVPVIDEDDCAVDYAQIISQAIELGYESVMVDGSRLPFQENIEATRKIADLAHEGGIPVEAELGAVLGHESGPLPPYDKLFESGQGFTDPLEAKRFVTESKADWLSVAIGNVHGAISAARSEKKIEARLNLGHLQKINSETGVPLVLHGGTGIRPEMILESFSAGIAKINIATAIRQPYEKLKDTSIIAAQEAVYQTTFDLLKDELKIEGSADSLLPLPVGGTC